MPDDIPAQPLPIEIATEPKAKADPLWLAQKRDVQAPLEPPRVGGDALSLPITSNYPACAANHSLRLTDETTGAWLVLA